MLSDIYQTILSENSAKLYAQMKDAGWIITHSDNGSQNTHPDDATQWQVTTYADDGWPDSVTIRVPALKNRTIDKILALIAKKQSLDAVFVNLSKYVNAVFDFKTLDAYPSSYGIGVVAIHNKNLGSEIAKIESKLNELGIVYSTDRSEAGWIYRFKVSKNAHNMNILKNLK